MYFYYKAPRETQFGETFMNYSITVMALVLGFLISGFAQAQSTTTTTTSSTNLSQDLRDLSKNFGLTLDTEINPQRDKNNDYEMVGYEQSIKVEPGYRINKKNSLMIGATYRIREHEDKTKENKNRDYMNELYIKHLYKPTKFKKNGIADVRISTRYYSVEDPVFSKKYGSNGNYQLRTYFGRPLFGKFSINKYTTYLRYKKYVLNKYASDRSRNYELRARFSPTYEPLDGLDLSMTFTYNHIFEQKSDKENFEFGPSIRYQKGPHAVLLYTSYKYLETDDDGDLAYNKNAPKDIGYGFSLSAYY